MADSDEGTAWWGGWLQCAKEKSLHVMEFMKRDITEFTQTVQADTTSAISSTTQTLKDKLHVGVEGSTTDRVKEGFSRMLTSISKSLNALDHVEDEQILNQTEMAIFDRAMARKHTIQIDPGTYCTDPDELEYQQWLATFNLDEERGNISELLMCKTEIRALYTQLVPAAVSHAEFWQRYFYRIHVFEQEEARKAAIMERADLSLDEIAWDEDDEWFGGDSSTITASSKDNTIESILESSPMTRLETKAEVHCPYIPASSFSPVNILVAESTNFDSLEHKIVNDKEISETTKSKSCEDSSIISAVNKISEVEKFQTVEHLDKDDNVLKEKIDIIVNSMENISEKNKPDMCINKEHNSDNLKLDFKENVQNIENLKSKSSDFCEKTQPTKPSDETTESIKISKSDISNSNICEQSESNTHQIDPLIKLGQSPENNSFVLKNKGDMVMIEHGQEHGRGTPTSIESLNTAKGDTSSGSLDEDWEQEFDLEVTPEDLKLAENSARELAKTVGLEGDDEWAGWE